MKKRKRNMTREEGLALVSRYRKSRLTQSKFAEAEGVTKAALQYWIHQTRKVTRVGNGSQATVRFVEVVGQRSSSMAPWADCGATLELAAARMRFDTLPPAEYVARIAVEMAKGLSC